MILRNIAVKCFWRSLNHSCRDIKSPMSLTIQIMVTDIYLKPCMQCESHLHKKQVLKKGLWPWLRLNLSHLTAICHDIKNRAVTLKVTTGWNDAQKHTSSYGLMSMMSTKPVFLHENEQQILDFSTFYVAFVPQQHQEDH
jgi:hypothetical protein